MSNSLILGRYYSVKSFIHLMNPLSKIICLSLFVLMTLISNSLLFGILLVGINVLIVYLSNVPVMVYLKSLSKMKIFLIFLFIVNIIFGVNFITNILMIIKIILLVNYSSILTLTTPPTEITYGLELFLKPLNKLHLPVNKVSLSISLALRFIPTIFDEATKILKSQASRGVDYYNSDIKGKIEAIKTMIIPMFNLSLKRADILADAMEVRLFSFDKIRTNYRINKWGLFDTLSVLVHGLLFIVIILCEVF